MEKNVSAAPISHSAKKKNGRTLSLYNSFHCRHMMIQSFVYSHLKNKPNPTRQSLSLTIICDFGQVQTAARNIVD